MAENQRAYYVHGIQMLSGLHVDCFGGSLVEDVGAVLHETGCSGTSVQVPTLWKNILPADFYV